MTSNPYHSLAEVYNHLMADIDYELWAEYVHSIITPFTESADLVLELASGNGEFAKFFKRHYPNMILSDLSLPMLQTITHTRDGILTCDMRALPFSDSSIAIVVCLFDSVNYILNQKELNGFFEGVYNVLSKDGIFVFDCCMFNGSKKHERLKRRIRKYNGITYQQVSKFNQLTGIHRNTFRFTLKDGTEIIETHKQRIYPFGTIVRKLMNTGFTILDCYQDFSYKEATEKSDRVHFVVRK